MKKYCLKNKKTVNFVGFKVPYLIFASGVVFAVLTVFMTVQTIASSAKLAYLENEELKLIKENEELNNNLIENSSLSALSKSSESLGFVKPARFIYSEQSKEVAKLP